MNLPSFLTFLTVKNVAIASVATTVGILSGFGITNLAKGDMTQNKTLKHVNDGMSKLTENDWECIKKSTTTITASNGAFSIGGTDSDNKCSNLKTKTGDSEIMSAAYFAKKYKVQTSS